ncbi:unnamed protein product [Macrosiphum euphorbiae]|uniref:Uncharacterized protein n=1 Tax=Macrosiphum euphorbiae TaxID=13131 RepID=A0AAV0XQ47_9HEMI|nr:unnamed protein product [Macrosiphum euphorbiae]
MCSRLDGEHQIRQVKSGGGNCVRRRRDETAILSVLFVLPFGRRTPDTTKLLDWNDDLAGSPGSIYHIPRLLRLLRIMTSVCYVLIVFGGTFSEDGLMTWSSEPSDAFLLGVINLVYKLRPLVL